MGRQPTLFSDQLRQAIVDADISRYQLSQLTGVSEAVLSRFVHGRGGLSLASIDLIVGALGLHVTATKSKRRKRK